MVGLRSIGPEITDELLKVLRKRLDETTLDIITVMLVRNCKLTPADVEVTSSLHCSQWHFHFPSCSGNFSRIERHNSTRVKGNCGKTIYMLFS